MQSAMTPTACDVDVLIIGGGIQGLVLLDLLTAEGYNAVLATSAPLGSGQSLHAHGLLESGYMMPKPELRASVVSDWLPYLKTKGVDVYGNWYVLLSEEQLQKFRNAWDAGGYPYELYKPTELPEAYRKGELFERNGETRVVKIKDFCFPKRQLIRKIAHGHDERIVHGDITGFTYLYAGNAMKIKTIEVHIRATDKRVSISPRYVILAAGVGTPMLINSIADGVSAAGGDGDKVRKALESVTFNNLHMLTLRGHPDDLPDVSAFVPLKRLKIVSHLNNGHDGVGGQNDLVTWYVTNEPISSIAPSEVKGKALGIVDRKHAAEGLNQLFSMVPVIRDRAKAGKIQFFVYAGCKQGIDGTVNIQHCEVIDGLINVTVVLPSLLGGVLLTAKKAVTHVQTAVKPAGIVGTLAGAGHVTVGDVAEHGDGVEWLNWNRLIAMYPGIEP